MRLVPTTQGRRIAVSEQDFAWASQYKWYVDARGYAYRVASKHDGKQKNVRMHRELLGLSGDDPQVVDHIDGNRLNNQRENLRACTQRDNVRNQRKRSGTTARFKGVYWNARLRKWHAQVKVRPQTIYLGLYTDPVDAARAYDKKARELFGEFARLNFPDDE